LNTAGVLTGPPAPTASALRSLLLLNIQYHIEGYIIKYSAFYMLILKALNTGGVWIWTQYSIGRAIVAL